MIRHPCPDDPSTARDVDTYRLTGDLTIKGVTRPVTVDSDYGGTAVDPYGNPRLGLDGRVVVDRKRWGVNRNAALEAGGVLASEKVTLEVDVSAIRTADPDTGGPSRPPSRRERAEGPGRGRRQDVPGRGPSCSQAGVTAPACSSAG